MTELDFGSKHLGASTDGPGDDRLLDLAGFDSFDDTVLLNTTDLAEEDEHLALRILLVSHEMIDEGRAGIAITTDGDTLISAIGDEGKDVIELIGHATGFGDVSDRTSSIKLGSDDVVHHSDNFIRTWLPS